MGRAQSLRIPTDRCAVPVQLKYWIDTEFIERPRTIDLISIGLADEWMKTVGSFMPRAVRSTGRRLPWTERMRPNRWIFRHEIGFSKTESRFPTKGTQAPVEEGISGWAYTILPACAVVRSRFCLPQKKTPPTGVTTLAGPQPGRGLKGLTSRKLVLRCGGSRGARGARWTSFGRGCSGGSRCTWRTGFGGRHGDYDRRGSRRRRSVLVTADKKQRRRRNECHAIELCFHGWFSNVLLSGQRF
jgi:hypothetical protein